MNPFPYIPLFFNRAPRVRVVPGVDFEWSPSSWSYNAFRLYELIFWRRHGIKAELSAWNDNGKTYYQFHSFESVIVFLESRLRSLFHFEPVVVYSPVFASSGLLMPSPYLFAIAADNQASATGHSGTSQTIASFALTGSNMLLVGHVVTVDNAGISGMTFNAVSMTSTFGSASQTNSDTSNMAQYAAVGVSGTHDVVGSWGSSVFGIIIATSYSGVNQSTTPDSVTTVSNTPLTTMTVSNTVVASNCWLMMTCYCQNTSSAGTGAFRRQQGTNVTIAAYDSNGTVGTGSQSMTVTTPAGNGLDAIQTSWAPVSAAGPTGVKTWDGVTQSTGIKTYEGVVLASTKSVNGVT